MSKKIAIGSLFSTNRALDNIARTPEEIHNPLTSVDALKRPVKASGHEEIGGGSVGKKRAFEPTSKMQPPNKRAWGKDSSVGKSGRLAKGMFPPPPRQQPEGHQSTIMWCEKHEPKTSAEMTVCIHKDTVTKVREWLQQSTGLSSSSSAIRKPGYPSPPPKRLLILSGPPGTGKSTTAKVLAAELGIALSEWNDTFGTVHTWRDRSEEALLVDPDHDYGDGYSEAGGGGREFHVPYTSQLDQFTKFLHSGAYGSLGLELCSKGDSRANRRSAASSGRSNSSSSKGANGGGGGCGDGGGSQFGSSGSGSSQESSQGSLSGRKLSSSGSLRDDFWDSVESSSFSSSSSSSSSLSSSSSALNSTSRMGNSSGSSSLSASSLSSSSSSLRRSPSVLFIESLPSTSARSSSFSSSLSFSEASRHSNGSPLEQLRSVLNAFVTNPRSSPAVLIYSDVAEKSEGANSLERLLGPELFFTASVEIINFNPITDLKAAKRLAEILRVEGIHRRASSVLGGDVGAVAKEVAERASGDLRKAINDLQLRAIPALHHSSNSNSSSGSGGGGTSRGIGSKSKSSKSTDGSGMTGSGTGAKANSSEISALDRGATRLSALHVIAKLLHGKKKREGSAGAAEGTSSSSSSLFSQQSSAGSGDGGKKRKGSKSKSASSSSSSSSSFSKLKERDKGVEWRPEELMRQCDMGVDAVSCFLQHNMVEFYGDVSELANGMAAMSDADLFVGRMFSAHHSRDDGDRCFPEEYAVSLSSRAVGCTNLIHPSEERRRAFQGITKSRIHESQRQRELNLSGLRQRLRTNCDLDTVSHPAATTDVLPFLQFFGQGSGTAAGQGNVGGGGGGGATGASALEAVLREDDIDEF